MGDLCTSFVACQQQRTGNLTRYHLHFMQNYKYIYTNAVGGLNHKSIFLIFIYFENRAVIINLVSRVRVSPFPVPLDKGNTHSGN